MNIVVFVLVLSVHQCQSKEKEAAAEKKAAAAAAKEAADKAATEAAAEKAATSKAVAYKALQQLPSLILHCFLLDLSFMFHGFGNHLRWASASRHPLSLIRCSRGVPKVKFMFILYGFSRHVLWF